MKWAGDNGSCDRKHWLNMCFVKQCVNRTSLSAEDTDKCGSKTPFEGRNTESPIRGLYQWEKNSLGGEF